MWDVEKGEDAGPLPDWEEMVRGMLDSGKFKLYEP